MAGMLFSFMRKAFSLDIGMVLMQEGWQIWASIETTQLFVPPYIILPTVGVGNEVQFKCDCNSKTRRV